MVISDDGGERRADPGVASLPLGHDAILHRGCYACPGETTIEDREIVTGHRPSLKALAHEAGTHAR
jgi:hypothetical protein